MSEPMVHDDGKIGCPNWAIAMVGARSYRDRSAFSHCRWSSRRSRTRSSRRPSIVTCGGGVLSHEVENRILCLSIPVSILLIVVDDDPPVRGLLETLIGVEGWQPESFASAEEFLSRPQIPVPTALCSMPHFRTVAASRFSDKSRLSAPTCRPYSSPTAATSRRQYRP
jgi:hypothetical protein